jgi:hypothetical protein
MYQQSTLTNTLLKRDHRRVQSRAPKVKRMLENLLLSTLNRWRMKSSLIMSMFLLADCSRSRKAAAASEETTPIQLIIINHRYRLHSLALQTPEGSERSNKNRLQPYHWERGAECSASYMEQLVTTVFNIVEPLSWLQWSLLRSRALVSYQSGVNSYDSGISPRYTSHWELAQHSVFSSPSLSSRLQCWPSHIFYIVYSLLYKMLYI